MELILGSKTDVKSVIWGNIFNFFSFALLLFFGF